MKLTKLQKLYTCALVTGAAALVLLQVDNSFANEAWGASIVLWALAWSEE